jgi:hypothetical protein
VGRRGGEGKRKEREGEKEVFAVITPLSSLPQQVQPKGPYIIAGNRLAFAMAYKMQQAGDEIQRLIILDDNHLWFDRSLVDSGITKREQRGAIGMIKVRDTHVYVSSHSHACVSPFPPPHSSFSCA